MELEPCLELLLTRRSVRKFRDVPVPDDLVRRILDVARYAPSAKNRQPWRFFVVRDRSLIRILSSIHRWAKPLERAPLCLVVVCDRREAPISYQLDGANATIYIMLAAHALGLGSVWIQTLRDIPKIQRILHLEEEEIPVSMIALGWPAESPSPPPRKELKDLLVEVDG